MKAAAAWISAWFAIAAPMSEAYASVGYPERVRDQLELEEIPNGPLGCTLCHRDDAGGARSVVRSFGRSLQTFGAAGSSPPSLVAALTQLENNRTDSDGDGASDIDELRAGEDPNAAAEGSEGPTLEESVPLPETGCSLSPMRRPAASSWLAAAGLLLFVCAMRRRLGRVGSSAARLRRG